MDDGNSGDGQFLQLQQAVVQQPYIGRQAGGFGKDGVKKEQIGSGAKSPTRAAQHHRLDRFVPAYGGHGIGKLLQQSRA